MVSQCMQRRPITDSAITDSAITDSAANPESRGSRYTLARVDGGTAMAPALLITGAERRERGHIRPEQNPVLVTPAPDGTHFKVCYASSPGSGPLPGAAELLAAAADDDEPDDEPEALFLPPADEDPSRPRISCERFGLFEYFAIAEQAASALNTGWTGPREKNQPASEYIRRWVKKRTAQAINARLHDYYKRTLAQLQCCVPQVVGVQRAVFAATFSAPEILAEPQIYERPYLVADLMKYRAAAVALANARDLAITNVRGIGWDLSTEEEAGALADELDGGGWRDLFSPDGASYRALNRTLDALPGGVPPGLVYYLCRTRLEAPISSRAALIVAMLYRSTAGCEKPEGLRHTPFFAEPDRIKRAVGIVSAHTGQPLSHRKSADLRAVVRFLLDYPNAREHGGNIVGLAEKSVRWHRDRAQQAARRQAERLGKDRQAKLPPTRLPDVEGLTFLSDVQSICEEGELMGHCAGSYARLAVEGAAYLFHAEYAGEKATAQVDARGNLVQSCGPNNRANKASRWAARKLKGWGGDLNEEPERTPAFDAEQFPF